MCSSEDSAGVASAAERSLVAYWRSEECLDKLEEGFVSRACLQRWAQQAFPTADSMDAACATWMPLSRQFYAQMLQKQGDPNVFYRTWAKVCALLDAATHALAEKKSSALLEDFVLLSAVCMGITFKEETQYFAASSERYGSFLLRACGIFDDMLSIPVASRKYRTENEVRTAEAEILQALRWVIPTADMYTMTTAMIQRASILTQGKYKDQLQGVVFTTAVKLFSEAVMHGQAAGYSTAREIVQKAMAPGLFEGLSGGFLAQLLDEAAPLCSP
jgi:hypothetical protein